MFKAACAIECLQPATTKPVSSWFFFDFETALAAFQCESPQALFSF
jgi:hypothetical protein